MKAFTLNALIYHSLCSSSEARYPIFLSYLRHCQTDSLMKGLKVGVQYQPFAEQSIIWKVNRVVSLDTPSAFVQSICVLLEIESLLVYLKTARTLAFDLCLFFLELHLPTSFVSTDWSGDSLLVFGSTVSNKARNPPLIPDGCSIAASAHHVRYLFQW